MSINLIVPNMTSYTNPELMLIIKTVNALIKSDADHLRAEIKIRNDIADLMKELKDVKNAWRNMG